MYITYVYLFHYIQHYTNRLKYSASNIPTFSPSIQPRSPYLFRLHIYYACYYITYYIFHTPTTYLYNMTACLLFSRDEILLTSVHTNHSYIPPAIPDLVLQPCDDYISSPHFLSSFFSGLRKSRKSVPRRMFPPRCHRHYQMLIFASTMHRRRTARVFRCSRRPSPLFRHLSPTRHCSICKINLYRSSIQPEALASLVRGNVAVECRSNGVADCIGSEVRILDRIEPLTAEADLTGEIDCSRSPPYPRPRPRPYKDTQSCIDREV